MNLYIILNLADEKFIPFMAKNNDVAIKKFKDFLKTDPANFDDFLLVSSNIGFNILKDDLFNADEGFNPYPFSKRIKFEMLEVSHIYDISDLDDDND